MFESVAEGSVEQHFQTSAYYSLIYFHIATGVVVILKRITIIAVLFPLLISACTKKQMGIFAGMATGVGAAYLATKDKDRDTRIKAMFGGAVAGALIGGAVGHYMDQSDQKELMIALQRTPINKVSNWTNPKTGHKFTIKPISVVYKDKKGRRYRKATLWGHKKGNKKLDVHTGAFYF
ncbi:hypothetical protein [Desulfonema magnum]|uniref:Glycine zipper 2TM domain-containing protein n=1 Tax=Desulfonema magnum TaxID=45655 RepID=A0A975BJJ3_9BACT|nr:hypothetical protein [Desulfonema magnum]QTA86540.1 Uncharacterized protein dnm_025640 [Desulfonema magnum]